MSSVSAAPGLVKRSRLHQTPGISETFADARRVSTIPEKVAAALGEGGPSPGALRIQRYETYESDGELNGFHVPIELGDIFEKVTNRRRYILLMQPCDLMVRGNGKRSYDDKKHGRRGANRVDGLLRQDRLGRAARSRLRRRGGPVTTPAMRSALADLLRRFLEHKRALHRKYRSEEFSLRLFDRYLAARGTAGFKQVDSALIGRFLQSRPRSARSHNNLLGVLRVFFAWAVAQRLTAASPVTARPRPVTARRLPFMFDLGAMRRLLAAARQLPDGRRTGRRPLVYETAFALIYGLGLRAGEAARCRLGDVDGAQATLLVRQTKFGKNVDQIEMLSWDRKGL